MTKPKPGRACRRGASHSDARTTPSRTSVAYFSMEIGLRSDMPTYSGGLGILAGDTIRAAADLAVPMVAVTLLTRRGYFHQKLDDQGNQIETPEAWNVADRLKPLKARASVVIEKRRVEIRAWQYDAVGVTGAVVPVIYLDTDLAGNDKQDRQISQYLYGGDSRYRLYQEYVLGVGGVRILRALGYDQINRFHMNEGHAAFLVVELLDEEMGKARGGRIKPQHIEAVKSKCVFTTHTPVPAGHDKFPMGMVRTILGKHPVWNLQERSDGDMLNMTHLALSFSSYVNGVSKKHGEVSQAMFPSHRIDSITNGVHAGTWVAPLFQKLLDRYTPGWRKDNLALRYAMCIPPREIWDAHVKCKARLIDYVAKHLKVKLDPKAFTIGFGRRATGYKRADLIFRDLNRLKQIASSAGAFQIIYAGKSHPQDQPGKQLIRRVFEAARQLGRKVRVVYLPNYDIDLAKILIPGVDVWLNNPQLPHEASGTSGMKAALNGVPSLSILDGWWIEGCVENLTGWAIEGKARRGAKDTSAQDAEALYDKLQRVVLPMFYSNREQYIRIMLAALALNGSVFNTQRMVQEYVVKAYKR
ncbi:MAG TPA: alpha-glucan family phosphorylase [Sedimentisphaerales bacterium]|jgi:starch phosphorylase|nr:alpha-glucan family phosphorylase [Sedimentisphaerales bacterium]HNU27933.1 alpha-glucan family phosphorylase [Sedimentisphaerales bacterium]